MKRQIPLTGTFLGLAWALSCTPDAGQTVLQAKSNTARYVDTGIVQEKRFERRLPVVGIVSPVRMVSLHFALAGRLQACSVKDGDHVEAGDVICRLETEIIDVEMERAKTALEASQKVLDSNFIEKQERLFKDGVIGQAQFERARVEYESAVASEKDARSLLELARKKRSEHLLIAPWSGRVSGLSLSPGQLLTPEVKVGVLTSSPSDGIHRLEIKMHASRFGSIKLGDPAHVVSVAGRTLARSATGSVVATSQSIEPSTQSFTVYADVELPSTESISMTEGMLVRGHIENRVTESGLVIPAASLIEWSDSGKAIVYLVDADNRLVERQVTAADYAHDEVLISSGLEPGEQIVTRYAADLYPGLRVQTGTHKATNPKTETKTSTPEEQRQHKESAP